MRDKRITQGILLRAYPNNPGLLNSRCSWRLSVSCMEAIAMKAKPALESWRLSDDLWDGISLLIPEPNNTHHFGRGRPRTPDRACMEAIVFVLRSGCQWKALDSFRRMQTPLYVETVSQAILRLRQQGFTASKTGCETVSTVFRPV